jgi:hypothetical protein
MIGWAWLRPLGAVGLLALPEAQSLKVAPAYLAGAIEPKQVLFLGHA